MESDSHGLMSSIENVTFAATRRWQKLMDDSVTYIIPRYITLLILILLYFVRVYFVAGFYIITYALGIYSLSLFIEFLSPLEDPEYANAEAELPTKNDEEYKPFIRKLPEFHLWYVLFYLYTCFLYPLSYVYAFVHGFVSHVVGINSPSHLRWRCFALSSISWTFQSSGRSC
jgi:hypothetical protein